MRGPRLLRQGVKELAVVTARADGPRHLLIGRHSEPVVAETDEAGDIAVTEFPDAQADEQELKNEGCQDRRPDAGLRL